MYFLMLLACGDVKTPTETNPEEVITTVEIELDGTVYRWADVEQDGTPEVDTIELTAGSSSAMTVRFLNELETPAEDITIEVEREGDEHQVLFGTGDTLTYTYGDTDSEGLPVGLVGTLAASTAGDTMLQVVLRHLPAESGQAVKVEGLEDRFDAGDVLPGDVDADVTFPVTITAP